MKGLRLVALAAATGLAGCVQAAGDFCDVEKLVNADVAGRDPITHCEALLQGSDAGGTSPMQRAQTCVLDAVQVRRASFTFFYDVPGSPGLRAGISGYRAANNHMTVHYYASSLASSGHPQLSARTCNELARADRTIETQALDQSTACTPGAGKPCLTCNRPGTGTLLCGQ